MRFSKPIIPPILPPLFLALLTAAPLPSPMARAAGADQQLYTCGMHPQIIKKEPGNCPICGMKLTPVRADGAGPAKGGHTIKYYKSTMMPGEVSPKPGKDSMGMDMVPVYEGGDGSVQNIQIDAATIQRMNLKTGLVARGPVHREIRNVGVVAYNEQGLRDITTKYEGWLEKLHVNATWTAVKAGDPLFEIYSPDLYNAQLNYLVALRSEGAAGGPLTRASLGRLQLFDVSAEFLAELARDGEAHRTYVFHAPTDGVVIEKMAVAGQMMKPGERIYRLADLSTVWVLAQVYENDLAFVHVGQPATVHATYGRDRDFAGEVALLLPQVEEQTRTATARLVLPNPDGYLRPGMFVDVRVAAQLAEDAVLVPEEAVLRSGERNTVFLARSDGTFEPREVKLGARSQDGRYEVLAGLAAGERVVTSGQFMLDSESQLREAIEKMRRQESSPAPAAVSEGRDGPPGRPQSGAPGGRALPDTPALTSLALALADAAAALGADDLAAYRRQLPALRATLAAYFNADEHAAHGPLAPFHENALPDRTDLNAARRDYAPLSTVVADLVRAARKNPAATGGPSSGEADAFRSLRIFECPMAPEIGKGRWLQRAAGIRNPFFGSAMPTCGEELDAPPPPAPRPEGHGRVMPSRAEGEALLAYLLTQTPAATGKAADGVCGNCGMSAAAMAAGEPCEHGIKTAAAP